MTKTRIIAQVNDWFLQVYKNHMWVEHRCSERLDRRYVCCGHSKIVLCRSCKEEVPTEIEAMWHVARMCIK